LKGPLAAFLLVATALSGCSDGGGSDEPTGTTPPLQAGKGAIAGLVINDVFRPVPNALVLLQPSGLTATSNDQGQFTFTNLEPGAYVLRIQADGHEAAPTNAEVRAGEYAEVEAIARRVINEAGAIVTTEYSVFVPCAAATPAATSNPPCMVDLSGDTDRFAFYANYTERKDTVTYLVTEMKANREVSPESGALKVVVRTETGGDPYWASAFITSGDYIRIVMPFNGTSEQDTENRNQVWNNTRAMQVALFPQGSFKGESQQALDTACTTSEPLNGTAPGAARGCFESRGIGAQIGVRAKFVQSLFIGEPDVYIATYCVLC
jgi:hypothetical protein